MEIEKQKKKRLSTEETTMNNDDDDENSQATKKKKYENTESDQSDSSASALKVEKESKKIKKQKITNSDNLNASDVNDDSSILECDKKEKKDKKLKRKASDVELKKSDQEIENKSDTEIIIPKKTRKIDENNDVANGEKSIETNEVHVDSEIVEKKKKRKRKRSKRRDEIEAPDTGLEIMAKREWKRLRNKYLDMQKAKMQQLKQHLKRAMWNQWQNAEKIKIDKDETNKKNAEKKDAPRFSYLPGLIVQIDMESPCIDPQNFKVSNM